jgi:hypothetical protein
MTAMGHRPDRPPPTGWKRWRCPVCSSVYDEPVSVPAHLGNVCPVCHPTTLRRSELVETAGGATPCPDCRAPIRWLTTQVGKRMPVDAEPSERGNVLLTGDVAGVLNPGQAGAARAAGAPLYLHHRLSCPFASRWAGGKRGRRA